MTLTDFLLARIAEDEEMSQACVKDWGPPWGYEPMSEPMRKTWVENGFDPDGLVNLTSEGGNGDLATDGYVDESVARHIARHDPDRVLTECAAKRRIVEDEHVPSKFYVYDDRYRACGMCGDGTTKFPCPTLRLIAHPYAQHPDFDPAWRYVD